MKFLSIVKYNHQLKCNNIAINCYKIDLHLFFTNPDFFTFYSDERMFIR